MIYFIQLVYTSEVSITYLEVLDVKMFGWNSAEQLKRCGWLLFLSLWYLWPVELVFLFISSYVMVPLQTGTAEKMTESFGISTYAKRLFPEDGYPLESYRISSVYLMLLFPQSATLFLVPFVCAIVFLDLKTCSLLPSAVPVYLRMSWWYRQGYHWHRIVGKAGNYIKNVRTVRELMKCQGKVRKTYGFRKISLSECGLVQFILEQNWH